MNEGYFTELADRLRGLGVAEDRIGPLVAELSGYAAESGAAPEDEFGPAAEFAAEFAEAAAQARAGVGAGPAPAADAERWVWTANASVDQEMMNRFGAQGWEIERVDHLGRFVSRRDPVSPLRWEYRRDVVGRRERARHAAALAPEGWEPCGHWLFLAYSKRPLAAVAGPAAELEDPPGRPARSLYLTRAVWAPVAVLAASLVLAGVLLAVAFTTGGGGSTVRGLLFGLPVGLVLGGAAAFAALRRKRAEYARASCHPDDV
ncbi:hypothetical protein DZF91_08295 [Actinomadura logoneensis]|uniref:DUF2812 domain-containing protein n=1 Tax=Actinomadura logoneensis TaxID=2293572 RepID=A0A372JQ19_9ACTN|nr:hypothetical protein [Actinomadura logoneensis]RFU42112.1 hypothetical protein DZF91_08295 [Actinomadura logoneensis]